MPTIRLAVANASTILKMLSTGIPCTQKDEWRLCLSYGRNRGEMCVDGSPQGACERHLVLPDGQQLRILGIAEVAQLDQGGGDIRRREHGKSRLAMAARQQPQAG